MVKVLLHQEVIPHYRVPIFNKLAENVDLTVAFSEKESPKEAKFKCLKVKKRKIPKMGCVLDKPFYRSVKENDILIHMLVNYYLDINHIKRWNPHIKTISWGIGVPASYTVRYDDAAVGCESHLKVIKRTDASVFYSSYPVAKYVKLGIDKSKLFVANNTVLVKTIAFQRHRSKLLFVGSLYKQKKIDVLLESYLQAYKENQDIPVLTIIGDGDQAEAIRLWVQENGLAEKIILTGGVYDEAVLADYFKDAIMTISPDQAGLSVLKSMGYGVPYVTHKNAITGGEIFNIHNGVDGILMDDFTQLKNIILESGRNPEKFIEMGKRAKEYYQSERSVDNMVQGFIDAIEYVMRK